ncbi:hypothetical protein Acr_00g0065540 [Actinidia rufa]|uniref:Reverse transcriptase zinc-binding domain-containing protein n=1 Tax=Actinidia rufa TaxID=165716 RepID=A0A7J0DPU1_9ERIC|nr:hypothetical protein Acr_00g0065540 [Actinidia rufa]
MPCGELPAIIGIVMVLLQGEISGDEPGYRGGATRRIRVLQSGEVNWRNIYAYIGEDTCIWEYNNRKQDSNLLKHILNVRDRILVEEGSSQAVRIRVDQWVINGKFSSKAAYEFFRPRKLPLIWPNLVWHSSIIPRHSFIIWLGLKERLQTKDKLHEFIDDKWLKITRAMSTLKSATKWLIKEARGTGIQSKAKESSPCLLSLPHMGGKK